MAYTTPPSGSQIQDFKTRNAIDALASNVLVLKDLISIGATVATPVPLSQGVAASYTVVSTLATDFLALRTSLINAGLLRP